MPFYPPFDRICAEEGKKVAKDNFDATSSKNLDFKKKL